MIIVIMNVIFVLFYCMLCQKLRNKDVHIYGPIHAIDFHLNAFEAAVSFIPHIEIVIRENISKFHGVIYCNKLPSVSMGEHNLSLLQFPCYGLTTDLGQAIYISISI